MQALLCFRSIPMNRPILIDEYKANAVEINNKQKRNKEIKNEVLKILDETGGWDDIYIQEKNKFDHNDDLVYEWVIKDYPWLTKDLTKQTIDWDKFNHFLKLGKLDISKAPPGCFSFGTEATIVSNRPRKTQDESE